MQSLALIGRYILTQAVLIISQSLMIWMKLCARVAAAIQRTDMLPKKLRLGSLTLNLTAQQEFIYGEDLLLTQKKFALLFLLVENKGKTLTKKYLNESEWNQPLANDGNTLCKQISTLRTKLEEYDSTILNAIRNETKKPSKK